MLARFAIDPSDKIDSIFSTLSEVFPHLMECAPQELFPNAPPIFPRFELLGSGANSKLWGDKK